MISWFTNLFKQQSHVEDTTVGMSNPLDNLVSSECNILAVCNQKEQQSAIRFIADLFAASPFKKILFHDEIASSFHRLLKKEIQPAFDEMNSGEEDLENFLLRQKAVTEEYGTPSTMTVFYKCNNLSSPVYKDIVTNNKDFHLTTLTIVYDICQVENKILNEMNYVVLFKEKSKMKQLRRDKLLHSGRFSKLTAFDNFHRHLSQYNNNMVVNVIDQNEIKSVKLTKVNVVTSSEPQLLNMYKFK